METKGLPGRPAPKPYAYPSSFSQVPKELPRKELGEGATCIKYLLFLFNLLFFMMGGAALGVAIWLSVDKTFVSIIMGNMVFAAAAYIFIGGGALMVVVTFLGCAGAILENKCMLLTYAVFLVIIFFLLIVVGILAIVFRATLNEEIKDHMKDSIRDIYGVELYKDYNQAVTHAWNKAQKELACCSVETNGWALYRASRWYTTQAGIEGVTKPYVPESCCRTVHNSDEFTDRQKCQTWKWGPPGQEHGSENYDLYYRGCYDAGVEFIINHSAIIIGMGITFAIIMIAGIVFAFILYGRLNR